MNFSRHILRQLKDWKADLNRKPLVLRGARQVGKTTLVDFFSKSYDHYIHLNLERPKDIKYFRDYDDVEKIVDALFLAHNIPKTKLNKTLLFIDEIQESPEAIGLLRYFYEDIPNLNVIAAGSLLEFAIRKVKSFPVGRIEYLYLHPLNFQEYLDATEQNIALDYLNKIPLDPIAHNTLMDLFNEYAIIGGMPEVVKTYIKTKSVSSLPKVYESIWGTYKNDVEKYTTNDTDRKVIKFIVNTAHLYLDERIKFQNFGNSNYKSREVGEAFRNLDDAKIIQLIYPTTDVEFPLKPDVKKSPRLQFLDTGLVNYSAGIQSEILHLKDLSNAYKGRLIPHLLTQELISLNTFKNEKPFFWVRDKKGSSAEVDLVYTYKGIVIPIEIKSGKIGTLKSLHQFVEKTSHKLAVRIYGGQLKIEQSTTPGGVDYTLLNLPYYLGTKIPEYVAWFVDGNMKKRP